MNRSINYLEAVSVLLVYLVVTDQVQWSMWWAVLPALVSMLVTPFYVGFVRGIKENSDANQGSE